jgi:hypothetical protein
MIRIATNGCIVTCCRVEQGCSNMIHFSKFSLLEGKLEGNIDTAYQFPGKNSNEREKI